MSNIPISQIVQVNPNVIGAGGAQTSLDGMVVTQSDAVPPNQLRVFFNEQDVAEFFGSSSNEYTIARAYFPGILGGGQQPGSLTFGRFAKADVAATVFGAPIALTLSQLQALTGTLTVVTSDTFNSGSINLSAATSFANAASLMTAGFTDPDFSITWDTMRSRFLLTTNVQGPTSSVSAVTGTLADPVGLSAASGAFVQAVGLDIDTPDTAMTRIANLSGNWGVFTHAWISDITERTAFAEWTSAQDFQFIYASWDIESGDLTANNPASFGAIVRAAPYQGTVPVYGEQADAAVVLGWAAATNYNMIEGRSALAFRQSTAGVLAKVDNLADANALLSNGYTYLGSYASTSNGYSIFYNGAISGQFLWADTFLGQIWLRRTLQQALFETLLAYRTLPYNADGYNAIYQGAQATIAQGVLNGVIRSGVDLSPGQRAEIDRQANQPIAEQVSSLGWYLQVTDPINPATRTVRGSPTVNFWYCDGGSIQKIVVSATTVL